VVRPTAERGPDLTPFADFARKRANAALSAKPAVHSEGIVDQHVLAGAASAAPATLFSHHYTRVTENPKYSQFSEVTNVGPLPM